MAPIWPLVLSLRCGRAVGLVGDCALRWRGTLPPTPELGQREGWRLNWILEYRQEK